MNESKSIVLKSTCFIRVNFVWLWNEYTLILQWFGLFCYFISYECRLYRSIAAPWREASAARNMFGLQSTSLVLLFCDSRYIYMPWVVFPIRMSTNLWRDCWPQQILTFVCFFFAFPAWILCSNSSGCFKSSWRVCRDSTPVLPQQYHRFCQSVRGKSITGRN